MAEEQYIEEMKNRGYDDAAIRECIANIHQGRENGLVIPYETGLLPVLPFVDD